MANFSAKLLASAPLTAIVYDDGLAIDPLMARAIAMLKAHGCTLAGFVQCDAPRPDRRRCDMVLVDLSSGVDLMISEDRGPLARGCRLDLHALARGDELGRQGLDAGADVLVVNKFGKTEAEGGGFRPLIAEAAGRGVPVLIAVPWRNIEAWRQFSGGLSREVRSGDLTDPATLLFRLGFELSSSASPASTGAAPSSLPRRLTIA